MLLLGKETLSDEGEEKSHEESHHRRMILVT